MSQKLALVTPASAVAQNGTFTASYPTGTTAGSFASYGHKIFCRGLQAYFSQDDGLISVSFGASSITVTYKGATSIPANTTIDCQFNIAGDANEPKSIVKPSRTVFTPLVRLDLGAPITASSNSVAASQSVAAGASFLLNGATGATLDVPRNIVAAWTTTSVLTITGLDEYGDVIIETSASGTSHTGKKAFKSITSISSSASITSATVGFGDVIGVPVFLSHVSNILGELQDGVILGANQDKVYIQANVPLTDGTYAISAAPIAGTITNIRAIVQGVFTTNNAVLTFKGGAAGTTAITGGVITELVASVAVGDAYSVTPSAANAVAVADKLMVVVSGTPGASKTTQVIIEITPTYAANGTFVAGDQTTPTGTTGDVKGTYDPTAACDGSKTFSLICRVSDVDYRGVDNYDG